MKINMMNDYNSVAHPAVLERLASLQAGRYEGYGLDEECEAAAELIKELIGRDDAEIHFMPGGTVTNTAVIGSALRPYEGVIAPRTAHIYQHETGAIESAGHKVLDCVPEDGKLLPRSIEEICDEAVDEHIVVPKLVYISQPTETGTVYSLSELGAIRETCDARGLLLFIDGARLGGALTSTVNDASLKDIANVADAFYIGGTKNGLLFGEAVILLHDAFKDRFRFFMKQRGGMLAKGFLLGAQFRAILEDGLYFTLASHANAMAKKLADGITALGFELETVPVTNQVFIIADQEVISALEKEILFERWHSFDDGRQSFRLVTTWATSDDDVMSVLDILKRQGR